MLALYGLGREGIQVSSVVNLFRRHVEPRTKDNKEPEDSGGVTAARQAASAASALKRTVALLSKSFTRTLNISDAA